VSASTPAQRAAEYLEHARRDLDRACYELEHTDGAEPEAEAAHQAAELADAILRTVRELFL
jgi:HEPN domain-containing protein